MYAWMYVHVNFHTQTFENSDLKLSKPRTCFKEYIYIYIFSFQAHMLLPQKRADLNKNNVKIIDPFMRPKTISKEAMIKTDMQKLGK